MRGIYLKNLRCPYSFGSIIFLELPYFVFLIFLCHYARKWYRSLTNKFIKVISRIIRKSISLNKCECFSLPYANLKNTLRWLTFSTTLC